MKVILFSCFFAFLLLQSCKPEEPPCLKSSCLETACALVDCDQIQDSIITFSGHQSPYAPLGYYMPDFNPNNSDEFVYVRDSGNNDAGVGQLIVYNKITQSQQVIFETTFRDIWGVPKWSSTNWIAFTRPGNQIWLIRPTGEELHQLTPDNESNTHYSWSPNGKEIAFLNWEDGLNIRDITTNTREVIDSAKISDGYLSLYHWSPDEDKIAYAAFTASTTYIGYIDISTGKKHRLFEEENPSISGINWLDRETIIWSSRKGLYTFNINTQEAKQWREHCDNISYRYPSVSATGNVLVQYHERSLVGDAFRDSIQEKGYIYELVLESCSEWEVELE